MKHIRDILAAIFVVAAASIAIAVIHMESFSMNHIVTAEAVDPINAVTAAIIMLAAGLLIHIARKQEDI